jgi:hypothetical protein
MIRRGFPIESMWINHDYARLHDREYVYKSLIGMASQ